MIFRQLFDYDTWTYTYLVGDPVSRMAALIDPVREQVDRDLKLISELDLTLQFALDTHVHADHVTGAGLLRSHTGCRTGVCSESGADCADLRLEDGQALNVGALTLTVLATPGHTSGCLTYRMDDRIFTGDALLIRGNGRTDFQGGDASVLYDSVTRRLFTLPDHTLIYPGHDYRGHQVSTIGEEKRHNPRLAGKTRDQFIAVMAGLNLSQPKRIQEAVPANRHCGIGQSDPATADRLREHSQPRGEGYWDLPAEYLRRHLNAVRIIDVRDPSEFCDRCGHLPGAECVPVGGLPQAAGDWNREEPIVLVCRTGRRSINGSIALRSMGFTSVFNLSGGMRDWEQAGFPLVSEPTPLPE